jgi:hypothetical protein
VVIVSVNYADFLAVTLPAWRELLPLADIRVVTSSADPESQRVALHCGCRAVVATEAFLRDDAVFNKAAALDEGFAGTPPGSWALALDADVFPVGEFPTELPRTLGWLGSVHRYACESPQHLAEHLAGVRPLATFPRIQMWKRSPHRADPAGLQGYFQLWRYRRGDRFGSYPTAAKYDVDFGRTFAYRRYLDGLYVLHLGEHRRNWSGRVTAPWRSISHEMEDV